MTKANITNRLVAHRGSPLRRPENTLSGVQLAVESGARFFEVDVQLTSDLVPILYHDRDLQRVSDQTGLVYETPWSELQTATAGHPERFGSDFAETPIATLQQLMEVLADLPDARVFVELKIESLDHFGVEKSLERILPVLRDSAQHDQVAAVISKNDVAIELTRKQCQLPIGWVLPTWSAENEQRAKELAPEFIFCNQNRLPADDKEVWQGDWKWTIYTVNDPEAASKLLDRGFDFVETDAIDVLQKHLA